MNDTAYLSNIGEYTVFRFQDDVIRFRCPHILEKYTEVKEWDNGYLVVMAKYQPYPEPIEEYISLDTVLDDLYYDTENYLKQIRKVCVKYDDESERNCR